MTTAEIVKTNHFKEHFAEITAKAERYVTMMIIGLWIFGVLISFHYDSWEFGLIMGSLSTGIYLLAYFFFRGTLLSRMIGAAVMALFMLQYLAQLKGLYEMHFWFFIMPILLIIYQDWRVFIPFAGLVVIHHTGIFALVMMGQDQYLEYFINMDKLTNMIFFYHMGLAVLGVLASAWTGYRLRKQTIHRYISSFQLSEQLNDMKKLALNVKDIASKISNKENGHEEIEGSEETSVSEALLSVGQDFTNIIENLITETKVVVEQAGIEGDLTARMSVDGKVGAWKDMANSINELMESISAPIVQLNVIANQLSKGNLTTRYELDAKGDIKGLADDLNNALTSLNDLLNQVNTAVEEVEGATSQMLSSGDEMETNTTEIASAIAQMSNGAQNQLRNIESTSDIIERVLQSAQEMEEKTSVINDSVKTGFENSEKGKSMVDAVVTDMESISKYSNETTESIKILTERSNEISRVLGVITEISSQTNLLALNAAIEAAQAGENGRGFAVVAEEIRKLAEDSRKSAKEIEKLVDDVKKDTTHAVDVMNEMTASVQSGVKSSRDTHEMFSSISEGSKNSLSLSEEVLDTTKVQTKSIADVVNNMESIVVIAEQTAAGSEEVATSANELSSGMREFSDSTRRMNQLGSELKESMSKFKLSKDSSSKLMDFESNEILEELDQ